MDLPKSFLSGEDFRNGAPVVHRLVGHLPAATELPAAVARRPKVPTGAWWIAYSQDKSRRYRDILLEFWENGTETYLPVKDWTSLARTAADRNCDQYGTIAKCVCVLKRKQVVGGGGGEEESAVGVAAAPSSSFLDEKYSPSIIRQLVKDKYVELVSDKSLYSLTLRD